MNSPKKELGWRMAAVLVWVVLTILIQPSTRAQTTGVEELLDQSYHAMYDLRFDEALRKADAAKPAAPDDPLPGMAQACAILFREFDRLHILNSEMFSSDEKFAARSAQAWDPSSRKQFENALSGAE